MRNDDNMKMVYINSLKNQFIEEKGGGGGVATEFKVENAFVFLKVK